MNNLNFNQEIAEMNEGQANGALINVSQQSSVNPLGNQQRVMYRHFPDDPPQTQQQLHTRSPQGDENQRMNPNSDPKSNVMCTTQEPENRVETTHHQNIMEQNSEFIRQLRQSQAQISQNQKEAQDKYMQNYLNQSLRGMQRHDEEEIKQRSHHGSLDQHRQVNERNFIPSLNQPPTESIPNHQRASSVNQNNRNAHNQSALSVHNLGLGNADSRKNDKQYACLIIKRAEFYCTKDNLIKHSNYLMRVFDKQEFSPDEKERNSQLKIKLPDSTKADILIMFLDYIDKGKELPNQIDLYIAQNVILIAEALKMRQIEKKFLLEILMPMLNRENIIFFTKMSYNKLTAQKNDAQKQNQDELESQTSHDQEEGYWLEFFSYALDFAALHVLYLLKKKSNEMLNVLETQIIEEIIERGIKFYRADLAYDSTLLFDMLMKIKKCDSIFQLLEQERQKILESEQKNIDDYNVKGHSPTLTWKIQSLSGNFYKESDPFLVENAQWKLSVSYFKMDEEALSVQIKMVNNPFEVKKSKDYFKKKEFFLPSNVAGGMSNQYNLLEQAFDDENLSSEEIQKRKKQMELANSEFPAHSFITIVSSVRIDSNEKLSDPQVNTLICSAKTPALLRKFLDFRIEDYKNTLNVEISIKVKYSYSAILLYISKNFTFLITDPHISLLPKEPFKLLLKHKMLNVTQEDEVLKSLCMWAEGQDLRPNLDTDLSELLENVNWNFVTLACLLDLIRNFPYVRRNMTFHKIINKEFTMRSKFNEETSNLDAPRHCYKYNKTQNIAIAAKEGKNAKALLYINHDNFFQNLIDQMLEPVDIIKAHLVNEGINESSHRKNLELQLFQKKREMQQIEDQLFNMRLMDEMDRSQSRARRPNSQVSCNQTNSIMKNGNHNNISEIGDDVETVKNSMINLLNVIVEDSSKRGSTQQNVTRGHKLVELSQEAIQKMQHINNSQMDQIPAQRVDSEYQPPNQENPQTFENMYQELESMAQNKRIQIAFKTQDLDEEEEESKHSQHQYEEEQKSEESMDQFVDNHNSNSVNQITPSQQVLQPRSQIQIQPNKQHTTSQSSQIIFGGASIVSPKQQQDQQTFAVQQTSYNKQYQAIIAESKSIQTSLQNIVLMQQRSIGQSRPGSSVAVVNTNAMRDQSVQMTFEEPPETPKDKQQSMIKGSETIRDEEQEHHHFVSHSSVHSNRLNQDSGTQQSAQSLRSAIAADQSEKEDKVVVNEKQQQFEQLKMKYQKKFMQEYTSMVQKMSKDVFDENFLKNIQLFSPGCLSQGPTADMTNSYVVPSPFSTIHNNQAHGQVSVKNPKVHNLNISIHNNANYASPFTDGQTNFTPLDRNLTIVGYPQKVQSPIESKQKAIPLKSNAMSKMVSPHNNLQKNIKQNMQAFVSKQKPKSAQQYSQQGYKKPQNMMQLQIEEQNQTLNSSASGNTTNNNANYPQSKYQGGLGPNTTSVTNQNYQTMLNQNNQHEISYAQNSMKNIKTTSKANNHSIQKGIMVMPGSTKNNSGQNKQQIYNYQGQQQMHQKVVKASNNKNQQNKFILQTLLNETQKVNQLGESLLQGKQPQIMMTIDPSTQPTTQGPLAPTPKSHQPPNNTHFHHQKSSSLGGTSAFLNQWAVLTQGQQQHHLQDPQMIPQSTITSTKMRDKSNEQLQNEIIRMIVEDIPVPQMQHNANYEPKVLQNWVQQSQTPLTQGVQISHSFQNKRSSVQQASYVGQQTNFNILDDIKHQVAQTPQYQSMLRPQFVQQQPSTMKPQSAGFGSLATHQRINSSNNTNAPNGGGSVMLDLAQLKMAVSTKNQHQQQYVPLGTIEELKTGPPMESDNGMPETHNKTYQSQQSLTLHGRKGSQQLSSSGGRPLVSSQSFHSNQQAAAYNRCQPHDINE